MGVERVPILYFQSPFYEYYFVISCIISDKKKFLRYQVYLPKFYLYYFLPSMSRMLYIL